ncbi:MAG: PaaI family thioesterase [Candidatus Hydrogenedentes bacterium]|nr:PaaI family thioesterase [Candidatus Hydrogenedentota bacterium]
MENEKHFRKLERMYLGAPVNRYYLPTIQIGAGSAQVAIQVRSDLFHAAHAVHGVVYFKVLDDAAFFAANSLVEDVFVLTVSLNVYLTRPISEGVIAATGRVVHSSRRLIIAEAEAVDGEGRPLARGTGTFMRSNIALTPEIGYQ